METNALPGGVNDTIAIPPGTYTLAIAGTGDDLGATGDLDISDNLTITGSGADTTVIDGGGLDRVFQARVPPALGAIEVRLSDLTIQNGVTTDPDIGGGGIAVVSQWAVVSIDRVAISGNQSASQLGGGMYSAGHVAIHESTLSGNTAQRGGGIYHTGLNGLGLVNSTLSANMAATGGCALEAEPAAVPNTYPETLVNVTISGGATDQGCTSQIVGAWTMRRTIVSAGGVSSACSGAVIDSTRDNLDSDGSCGLNGPGDLSNIDPKLGPLADNGGPTRTHALQSGSPAIDAAHDVDGELCDQLDANDQRGAGFPRRTDGNGDGLALCDIGAFELQPAPSTPAPSPPPTSSPTPPTRIALPNTGGAPGGNSLAPVGLIVTALAVVLLTVLALRSARLPDRHRGSRE